MQGRGSIARRKKLPGMLTPAAPTSFKAVRRCAATRSRRRICIHTARLLALRRRPCNICRRPTCAWMPDRLRSFFSSSLSPLDASLLVVRITWGGQGGQEGVAADSG